jgi:tetratricopeptide (TPR) repeat protein
MLQRDRFIAIAVVAAVVLLSIAGSNKQIQKAVSDATLSQNDRKLVEADSALEQGNLRTAINLANEVCKADPTSIHAHRILAGAYEAIKDYDGEIQEADIILAQNPHDVQGLLNRSVAHFSTKQYQKAYDDAKLALSIQPRQSAPMITMAMASVELNRLDEAEDLSWKAIKAGDTSYLPYAQLGKVSFKRKQYGDALLAFNKALSIKEDATVYHDRSLVYRAQQQGKKSRADIDRALALEPNNQKWICDKAELLNEYGLYRDSIDFLQPYVWYRYQTNKNMRALLTTAGKLLTAYGERGVREYPRDPRAWTDYAYGLYYSGQAAKALIAANRAIELNPRAIESYRVRANIETDNHDAKAAVKDWSRIVSADPSNGWDLFHLAFAQSSTDDTDSAIANYRRTVALIPDNAIAYYDLGLEYEEKHDESARLASLQAAVKLDPLYQHAHRELTRYYLDHRDNQHAVEEGQTAVALDPEDCYSHELFSCALQHAGEVPRAQRELKIALAVAPDASEKAFVQLQHAKFVFEDGDLSAARSEIDALRLESIGVEKSNEIFEYGGIGWASNLLCGDPTRAITAAQAAMKRLQNDPWHTQVLNYMVAGAYTNSLIDASKTRDERTEADFYTGVLARSAGHPDDARKLFQHVLSAGTQSFDEYGWAQAMLNLHNSAGTTE